jgi:uncharacterized membrane protein (UPF0127 family)
MRNPFHSWFDPPTATVVIARRGQPVATFGVELARNPWRRARGLMGRTSLPEDGGMLFVYPWPRKVCIWMARVQMALDVLFVDENDTVTKIATGLAPRSMRIVGSDAPVKRVFEVAAGALARAGVAVGDQLRLCMNAVESRPAPRWAAVDLRTRAARLIGRGP